MQILDRPCRLIYRFVAPEFLSKNIVGADDAAPAANIEHRRVIVPVGQHNIDDAALYDENVSAFVADVEQDLLVVDETLLGRVVDFFYQVVSNGLQIGDVLLNGLNEVLPLVIVGVVQYFLLHYVLHVREFLEHIQKIIGSDRANCAIGLRLNRVSWLRIEYDLDIAYDFTWGNLTEAKADSRIKLFECIALAISCDDKPSLILIKLSHYQTFGDEKTDLHSLEKALDKAMLIFEYLNHFKEVFVSSLQDPEAH